MKDGRRLAVGVSEEDTEVFVALVARPRRVRCRVVIRKQRKA